MAPGSLRKIKTWLKACKIHKIKKAKDIWEQWRLRWRGVPAIRQRRPRLHLHTRCSITTIPTIQSDGGAEDGNGATSGRGKMVDLARQIADARAKQRAAWIAAGCWYGPKKDPLTREEQQ
jgi:hypothetical protein